MSKRQPGCAYLLVVVALGSMGCAAAIPELTADAERVRIQKGDAPRGYAEIGPVSAIHGSGCGGFGERGSYEGAYAVLKNRAAELRADFVRIDVAVEPHPTPQCFVNEYAIRGVAYRRSARRPAAGDGANIPRGSDQDVFRMLRHVVGQRVVVYLRSGEILAATVGALAPPDGVQLVLLDQSARSIRTGDIERWKAATSEE